MTTLKALVSGLPLSASDILSEALAESFGSGVVDIVSLNKDNLRQMVRLSTRDPQTVLVILDQVSTDMCKSIENGLYSSGKFFSYSNDSELVAFLNNKYAINIVVPEEPELELSEDTSRVDTAEESSADVEGYLARIQDQGMLIQSLQNTITELESKLDNLHSGVEDEEKSAKIEELNDKVISLSNQLQSISADKDTLSVQKESLEEHSEYLTKELTRVKKEYSELEISYENLSKELSSERIQNSKMSGLIREMEGKVHKLETSNNKLKKDIEASSMLTAEKEDLERRLSIANTKISNLSTDNSSKQETIDSLNRQISNLGDTNKQLSDLRADYSSLQDRNAELEKDISSYKATINELQSKQSSDIEDVNELRERIKELESRSEADNESLTKLNQERVELLAKIQTLSKSTSRDTDVEEIMSELSGLRDDYFKLKNSIFGKIASYAMPKASSPIFLTRKGVTLNHIRFSYAGNSASRKGAYRCILNELKGYKGSDRFLIVDVVSETFVDYVFEIKKVVNGIDWFRQGGGIHNYLSNTCLKNVQVLSPGLGYINEAYFLTVDWESRLTELENSGYNVIIFFGDISNMIGRIFHESFADLGNSIIYVEGNATGSRTLVSNLKGLSNGKSSIIAYYNFNKQVKRFYDMVAKTNECRVLSVI